MTDTPVSSTPATDPIRIANCSGFFGDRPSGALEMVEGGPIDVLTGDWLAELTMLILHKLRERKVGGYARTFVTQMEQVMGACLDGGIKVVSNAGGLDPAGCADALAEVADRLGLAPTIAVVDGDDLVPRLDELAAADALHGFGDESEPAWREVVTANAYLGAWGIVEALERGADIVVTGRVTDAAVCAGPAAWHHGWGRHDLDAMAGAVVAGHVIECSAQATGGNYSFFTEIPGWDDPDRVRFGFPWAEVAADGSSVIGKHDGTGGLVDIGTVTSQLLYEIGGPRYGGPDVVARFDTIELDQVGPDRVRISGVRGEAPPSTLKVATNELGGYRNSISLALTGLDVEAKARFAETAFWDACPFGPADYDEVDSRVIRTDAPDAASQEEATAVWRLTVKDRDEAKVGRAFADAFVHTGLASIPGLYGLGGGPSGARAFGVYRPGAVDAGAVPARVTIGGEVTTVDSAFPADAALSDDAVFPADGVPSSLPEPDPGSADGGPADGMPTDVSAELVEVPLGRLVGARSGDKGGAANVGLFARSDEVWRWLDRELTIERFQAMLPETAPLDVERHRFPHLRALNFVANGLLGVGVAASTRQDAQAKAVGEWLRARTVRVPAALVPPVTG